MVLHTHTHRNTAELITANASLASCRQPGIVSNLAKPYARRKSQTQDFLYFFQSLSRANTVNTVNMNNPSLHIRYIFMKHGRINRSFNDDVTAATCNLRGMNKCECVWGNMRQTTQRAQLCATHKHFKLDLQLKCSYTVTN